jgi:hypothetical protein
MTMDRNYFILRQQGAKVNLNFGCFFGHLFAGRNAIGGKGMGCMEVISQSKLFR